MAKIVLWPNKIQHTYARNTFMLQIYIEPLVDHDTPQSKEVVQNYIHRIILENVQVRAVSLHLTGHHQGRKYVQMWTSVVTRKSIFVSFWSFLRKQDKRKSHKVVTKTQQICLMLILLLILAFVLDDLRRKKD